MILIAPIGVYFMGKISCGHYETSNSSRDLILASIRHAARAAQVLFAMSADGVNKV